MDYKEYAETCEVLLKWAEAYAAGESMVDDSVYDAKYLELKKFEAENPAFILANSPTRCVVDGAVGFRKVKHIIPMISISNSNGIEETIEWATRMFGLSGSPIAEDRKGVESLELEYKIDGLGLALHYKEGQFVDAVTRGVDNVGDSVWENALRISSIPKTIPLKGQVEIRGEVVWKFDDFEKYNDQLDEEGKKRISNPRNGAAGTLKSHDPLEVERRNLSFIGYLIVQGSPKRYQSEDIDLLGQMGFEVPPHFVVSNLDDLRTVAENLREKRYEQEYPIDGVVLKVNDKQDQARFGYTAKSPNFYRAYKFPPEEKVTVLRSVEQSGGMSGAITPVAVSDTVTLAMTNVSRVSLHNWQLVEYLGLTEGCHIILRKAGEIIPEFVKCVETGRTKDNYKMLIDLKKEPGSWWDDHPAPENAIRAPKVCPFCGAELVRVATQDGDDGAALVCPSETCRSKIVAKMIKFVDRKCMNLMGIGDSLVDLLHTVGVLNNPTDFYKLDVKTLASYGNIREKRAEKLVRAINATRDNYLHQLIEGFAITGIGHQASPVIANVLNGMGGLGALINTTEDVTGKFIENCVTQGISDTLARNFLDFVANNTQLVCYFVDNGIAQKVKEFSATSTKLEGRVCIMTGVFDRLEREKFKEMVLANGGTICSSITKKCNLVLMGDGAGPKKVKAIDDILKAGGHIDVFTPDTLDKFLDMLK